MRTGEYRIRILDEFPGNFQRRYSKLPRGLQGTVLHAAIERTGLSRSARATLRKRSFLGRLPESQAGDLLPMAVDQTQEIGKIGRISFDHSTGGVVARIDRNK